MPEELETRNSSHVARVRWYPADEELTEPGKADYERVPARALDVTFHNGRTYRYFDVAYDTWNDLMQAKSKGGFLRKVIQPKHRVKELKN